MRTNLLTEAQAKEKGCCIPEDHKCAGSICMAWRWADEILTCQVYHASCFGVDSKVQEEPPRPSSVPASYIWMPYDLANDIYASCWIEPPAELEARYRGYCGLAGRVEV